MDKKGKNISKIAAISATAIISISSILLTEDELIKHKEDHDLNQLLSQYGYQSTEEISHYEAGYLIGKDNSYYRTNYELHTKEKLPNDYTIFKELENIYNGRYKEEYITGLQEGIEDGTTDAINNYNKEEAKPKVLARYN